MTDAQVHDGIHGSVLGRWWWSIDRWVLAALVALIVTGALLALAAGPAAAGRLAIADRFHFVRAQLVFLPAALLVMLWVSLLSARTLRRLAVLALAVGLPLTALTLAVGPEINGARRWLAVAGLSIQPSEFLKPALAVTAAWLFSAQRLGRPVPGYLAATVLAFAAAGLLLAQPDIGNAAIVLAIWFAEFFLAGLPVVWVFGLAALGAAGAVLTYMYVGHVAARIDAFLDPGAAGNYQINTALDAFRNGGLFGRGPGEGTVKAALPDAHSDFIFAVAGEELGIIACLVIVALFAFVVLRGFARLMEENDLFALLAVAGLLTAFGLQALVNMASTLRMLPTKGITLPFVSYGGSSLLALAFGMGIVLALTRRRRGEDWL